MPMVGASLRGMPASYRQQQQCTSQNRQDSSSHSSRSRSHQRVRGCVQPVECGVVWWALPSQVNRPTPPCALPRLQVVGGPCNCSICALLGLLQSLHCRC